MPKGKKYTPEQIVGILRRIDHGETAEAVCREVNISQATLYRWKQQYGALELDEVKELKALREENAQLKRVVADQALNIHVLKIVNAKKWCARRPSATPPKAWWRRASVRSVRRAATLGWRARRGRIADGRQPHARSRSPTVLRGCRGVIRATAIVGCMRCCCAKAWPARDARCNASDGWKACGSFSAQHSLVKQYNARAHVSLPITNHIRTPVNASRFRGQCSQRSQEYKVSGWMRRNFVICSSR